MDTIGRASREFYRWTGPRPVVEVDGHRLQLPAFYHRVDSFQSIHLADATAVAAQVPSDDLHPVRWFDGRAVVMVWALRYHEVTGVEVSDGAPGTTRLLRPYGEVGVAALVSRRPLAKGFPLLRPSMPGVGGFVLHLPVTTAEARDIGRAAFGLPKFVADMDFAESPRSRSVRVSEGGHDLLSLTVHPRGPAVGDHRPVPMYSVLEDDLIETDVLVLGHRQVVLGRRAGRLRLGDHPAAESIRELGVDSGTLMVASHLDLRMILPLGVPIGRARSAHPGWAGSERASGRLTVTYPGTGPVDQYAVSEGVLT